MREITTHLAEGEESPLTIHAMDEPGPGGDNHRYEFGGFKALNNPSGRNNDHPRNITILFQNGNPELNDFNGVTIEMLLAVAMDRLECLQNGPFACDENEKARHHISYALGMMQQRTTDRIQRNVKNMLEK